MNITRILPLRAFLLITLLILFACLTYGTEGRPPVVHIVRNVAWNDFISQINFLPDDSPQDSFDKELLVVQTFQGARNRSQSWSQVAKVHLKKATFSIDGDVFNASVGSIVVIPAGAHHAWRNRSNAPIRMSTFFSPGGVEELYPKLVGLSLEELSTAIEPFGSGIVGPPIDE